MEKSPAAPVKVRTGKAPQGQCHDGKKSNTAPSSVPEDPEVRITLKAARLIQTGRNRTEETQSTITENLRWQTGSECNIKHLHPEIRKLEPTCLRSVVAVFVIVVVVVMVMVMVTVMVMVMVV